MASVKKVSNERATQTLVRPLASANRGGTGNRFVALKGVIHVTQLLRHAMRVPIVCRSQSYLHSTVIIL